MAITIANPYARAKDRQYHWLRGNLHAHSTRSDGKRSPQAVLDAYARLDYHFFALSDHDVLADYEGLDSHGMILIRGNEVSQRGIHILHVSADRRVEPAGDRQKVIDEINANGGFAVMNHPNWTINFNHIPFEKLLQHKGYLGIEIFNGVTVRHEGSAYGLDKWDQLLSTGRIVWGFANDDSHAIGADDAMGWNVVQVPADQQTPEALVQAMRDGAFYASTGVTIESIQTSGERLKVIAPNAQAIEVIGEHGRQLQFVEGGVLDFDASGVAGPFIRVQCYGAANRRAWTQPFLIRGGTAERVHALALEKPVLKVLRSAVTPPLTSNEDGQWQKAAAATTFYRLPDAAEPEVKTSVRCICSPTDLIFSVHCDEPEMAKLKTVFGDNDFNLWGDDGIEFFLDTDAGGTHYFHVQTNAAGKFSAVHTARDVNLKYQIHAAREKNAWTLQLAINFASMELKPPKIGERWGFQLCRNRTPVNSHYVFTWSGGSNHNPSAYGWLEF